MRRAARLYVLDEVIENTGVSRRTLRTYEEVGLVGPSLREGGSLLYAEETVETIQRIRRLQNDLGVNLAGVQVILEMRKKIEDLQRSLEEVVQFVRKDLRQELEQYLRRQEKAVVPKSLADPPTPIEEE